MEDPQLAELVLKLSEQIRIIQLEVRQDKSKNEERHECLESKLDEHTALTKEWVDLFQTLKGGFKVIGWFGSLAKWVAMVGGACVAIYYWFIK